MTRLLADSAAFDRHARYPRKLKSWPCYYRAADPALAAALREPGPWAQSAHDGDASSE